MVAISEVAAGAPDDQVLERALNEKRVLVTEDRDFGELVYARGRPSTGVILVRFPSSARRAKNLEESVSVVDPEPLRVGFRDETWTRGHEQRTSDHRKLPA